MYSYSLYKISEHVTSDKMPKIRYVFPHCVQDRERQMEIQAASTYLFKTTLNPESVVHINFRQAYFVLFH